MNPQVESMIAGFRSGIENILNLTTDESKIANLKTVYDEMIALADAHGDDMMTFVNKANGANLFNRLSEEMEKASNALQEQQSDQSTARTMTSKDIADSYRTAYEIIKRQGYMQRTEKTYEEIFSLAETIPDAAMLQVEIFRKELPLQISLATLHDEATREKEEKDPNNLSLAVYNRERTEAARDARSADQAKYQELTATFRHSDRSLKDEQRYRFIEKLCVDMLAFYDEKSRLRREGIEKHAEELIDIKYMRDDIRKTYEFIVAFLDMDFDAIASEMRYIKKLLWVHTPFGKDGRIWLSQDPQNIDFFRDILFNEILSEREIHEILLREAPLVYNPPGTEALHKKDTLHETWYNWIRDHAAKYPYARIDENEIMNASFNYYRLNSFIDFDAQKKERPHDNEDYLFDILFDADRMIRYATDPDPHY